MDAAQPSSGEPNLSTIIVFARFSCRHPPMKSECGHRMCYGAGGFRAPDDSSKDMHPPLRITTAIFHGVVIERSRATQLQLEQIMEVCSTMRLHCVCCGPCRGASPFRTSHRRCVWTFCLGGSGVQKLCKIIPNKIARGHFRMMQCREIWESVQCRCKIQRGVFVVPFRSCRWIEPDI